MTTFLAAIVLLGVLIFVHELGHFLWAKALGVMVERFSLGLGPRLLSRKIGETEYILAAVPFGGYVKMLGEDTSIEDAGVVDLQQSESPRVLTEEELKRAFNRQPIWKRITIVIMGPVFNILLAYLIFAGLLMHTGLHSLLPVVGGTIKGMPVEAAGIINGDTITAIDGQPVATWDDMTSLIRAGAGKPLDITVERKGQVLKFNVTPVVQKDTNLLGDEVSIPRIGIQPDPDRYIEESVGPLKALGLGALRTYDVAELTVMAVVRLVQGRISSDNISGPIGIVSMAGKQAEKGLDYYLIMMAVISVNLGILNALPIPVLDGGHILFFLIEAVRRKPLSESVIENSQKVGIALIIVLFLFATYNDITRLLAGKSF